LSDNSGKTLDYRYWGSQDEKKVRALYDSIKADSVVHVQGKVSVYNNKLQLTTNEPFIIEPLKEDEYDKADFIKPARKDIDDGKTYGKNEPCPYVYAILPEWAGNDCKFPAYA